MRIRTKNKQRKSEEQQRQKIITKEVINFNKLGDSWISKGTKWRKRDNRPGK